MWSLKKRKHQSQTDYHRRALFQTLGVDLDDPGLVRELLEASREDPQEDQIALQNALVDSKDRVDAGIIQTLQKHVTRLFGVGGL